MTPSTAEAAIILGVFVLLLVGLRYLARRLLVSAAALAGQVARRTTGAARHLPLIEPVLARFPKLTNFLAHRFTPHSFTGLPLTLMVAAALYLLFLMGGLAEEMLEAEELLKIDDAIASVFDPWRATFLTDILLGITELGDTATMIAVVVVSTGFLWSYGRFRFILPLWVCVLGSKATTWLGKFGFARARPEFLTEATALSPSFPSAHATAAMAVYGFIAYALVRDLPSPAHRFEIVYWTGVLIALIAFSRIFLSVHFTSDVAAGLLVGAFWLLVGFGLAELPRSGRRA